MLRELYDMIVEQLAETVIQANQGSANASSTIGSQVVSRKKVIKSITVDNFFHIQLWLIIFLRIYDLWPLKAKWI